MELEDEPSVKPEDVLRMLEGDPSALPAGDAGEGPMRETELGPEDVRGALRLMYSNWTAKPEPGKNMALIAAERFGVGDEFAADELVPSGRDGLAETYDKKRFCLLRLQYHFVRLGLMDVENPEDDHVGESWRKQFAHLHETILRLHDCLLTNLLTHKCLDPQWAKDCPVMLDPFGVTRFDMSKVEGSRQVFVVFVAHQIQKLGLRRYRGELYREKAIAVMGPEGLREIKTHAWERYKDVKTFVNQVAPKETHFEMWQHSMTGSVMSDTVRHFTEGFEQELPELKPDRHYHSFQNGIYHTARAKFMPYGDPSILPETTSCKYHDHNFDTEILKVPKSQWYAIPTPKFHKILWDQLGDLETTYRDDATGEPMRHTAETAEEFNRLHAAEAEHYGHEARMASVGDPVIQRCGNQVARWAYILFGRLLFELNHKDCWQVIPFIVGRAGTGKSLILSTISSWFHDTDIGIVSNDQQKGFGLETIYDKFLWLAKEVKHDFAVDQAQFQSMITGEEMSIQAKFKSAVQVVWKAPGLLAGNEVANWSDNSGSISRRLILFYFNKAVKQSNPMLMAELRAEMPLIMHKCCVAYLSAVAWFGKSDLWGDMPAARQRKPFDVRVLPRYFHDNKEGLKRSTHMLEDFIKNKAQVTLVPSLTADGMRRGMPFDSNGKNGTLSFKSLANAYFKQQRDGKDGGFQWKEDKYRTVFDDNGITMSALTDEDIKKGENWYNGEQFGKHTKWLWGVVATSVDGGEA